MDLCYIPDFPAERPDFDFPAIAQGLLPLLLRRDERGATVVGIHGAWGAGKTTLMLEIGRQLRTAVPDMVAIDFNAWKFQDREALWRALILQVLGELRNRRKSTWTKANPEAKDEDFRDPTLDELENKLYRAFSVDERGPWKVQWRTLIVETLTIGLSVLQLGPVASALKGSLGFFGKFLWSSGHDGKEGKEKEDQGVLNQERIKELAGVMEREVVHRQVNQVQSIEQFLKEFKGMLLDLESPDDRCALDQRRVFVFIDDLDRCLPESALEVFEAIRLFLDAPGIGYVVALDRDTIRKALAARYGRAGQFEKGQYFIDPDEYIEKTISVSFDLPKLSPEDAAALIRQVSLPVALNDDQRRLLVKGLGTNPRRLRRFMNTLAVNMYIAQAAGKAPAAPLDANHLPLFLKLMLISYRYSEVVSLARENPDLLIGLQEACNIYQSQKKNPDNARKARQQVLTDHGIVLDKFTGRTDFWEVLELEPPLNTDAETLKNMLNWFRFSPGPQTGA